MDWSGDGIPDVCATSVGATVNSQAGVGAAFFWRSGTGLTTTSAADVLGVVPNAFAGDALGN